MLDVVVGGATTTGALVLVLVCDVRDVTMEMNEGAALVVAVGSFLSFKHNFSTSCPSFTIPSNDFELTISPVHALATLCSLTLSAVLHREMHPILKSSVVQIAISELYSRKQAEGINGESIGWNVASDKDATVSGRASAAIEIADLLIFVLYYVVASKVLVAR